MAASERKNPAGITNSPANFMTLSFHGPGGLASQGRAASAGDLPDDEGPATGSQVRNLEED